MIRFQAEWIDSASQCYRAMPDKSGSLTDCLSFMVMEQRGLMEALTTHPHLGQAGTKPTMLEQPPS